MAAPHALAVALALVGAATPRATGGQATTGQATIGQVTTGQATIGEPAGVATAPEGPLNNSTYLAVEPEAIQLLEAGDAALARFRAEGEARRLDETLEAWHAAAALAFRPGTPDAVDHPGGPGTPDEARRAAVGIEEALLARLESLERAERRAWATRFATLAEQELTRAGSHPRALGALDRRHPGTLAAARAALRLADLEFEVGHALAARTWAERGLRHGSLAAPTSSGPEASGPDSSGPDSRGPGSSDTGSSGPRLAAALERRRRAAAETLARGPSQAPPATWKNATRLEALGRLELRVAPGSAPGRRARSEGPGHGVRPGLAFLDDGRLALQLAREVVLLARGATRIQSRFDPALVLRGSLGSPPRVRSGQGAPGWPLLPVALPGGDLVLVVGRASPVGGGNALTRIAPPAPLSGGPLALDVESLPRLVWALEDGYRATGTDESRLDPDLSGFEGAEFQPGPVLVGGRLLVQVRTLDGDIGSWLLCLDVTDGSLLWKRFLAQGADVGRGAGIPGQSTPAPGAAQPLLVTDGRVFAGTHLGVGSLVDLVDGRLRWSLRSRRRGPHADGLDGGRPLLAPPAQAPGTSIEGAPRTLVWGPADSDYLYWLADAPLPAGPLRLVPPPHPVGEGLALAAADESGALIVSRAGSARAISRWDAWSGGRADSLHLARGEQWVARGLASEARLLISSDRALYLFDRQRDCYLLDAAALSGEAPLGGSVHARGDRVLVLADGALWIFRAR